MNVIVANKYQSMLQSLNIDIIKMSEESTVVAKYIPIERTRTKYQTEEELEEGFIKQLTEQGYEYVNIKNENDLIKNLRKQLEKLNDYTFTENEWDNFFHNTIANGNEKIEHKTFKIQEERIFILKQDNGETKNIYLGNVGIGHGGGDMRLIEDFIDYLRTGKMSISQTNIDTSIDGHLVGMAADLSDKDRKTVYLSDDRHLEER